MDGRLSQTPILVFMIILAGARGNLQPAQAMNITADRVEQTIVFKAGDLGYSCFRIPVLLSVPGALLAFVEAREKSCSDYGAHSILVKRSIDEGTSWSDAILVSNVTHANTLTKGDGLNLGVALYQPTDEDSHGVKGKVWLAWVECFHKCTVPYQFVQSSSDVGSTWSHPADITEGIMALSKFSPGPGTGMYLPYLDGDTHHLLVCGWYQRSASLFRNVSAKRMSDGVTSEHDDITTETESRHDYADSMETGSACIYSDDDGLTWKSGVPVGYNASEMQPNECQPVATSNTYGWIMMTMRDERNSHHPIWSRSYDAGITWEEAILQTNVTTATCDGSMAAVNITDTINLFVSHPTSTRRENMEVHWSKDMTGAEWSLLARLWPGPAAYSCMAALPSNTVAVLYENGEKESYERITFARVAYSVSQP